MDIASKNTNAIEVGHAGAPNLRAIHQIGRNGDLAAGFSKGCSKVLAPGTRRKFRGRARDVLSPSLEAR